jgi:hypothetical protein
LIVDPEKRWVDWLRLTPDGSDARVALSGLIGLGPAELAERIEWPD